MNETIIKVFYFRINIAVEVLAEPQGVDPRQLLSEDVKHRHMWLGCKSELTRAAIRLLSIAGRARVISLHLACLQITVFRPTGVS